MEGTNFPLTGQSTTLPADLATGMLRYEKGKVYILVKNLGASLADGKTCKRDATVGTDITVVVGAAVTDIFIGVNNTGSAIADGSYFWALKEGRGYSIGSTIALGVSVTGAAAGVVTVAATTNNVCGQCIVANSEVMWAFPSKYNV